MGKAEDIEKAYQELFQVDITPEMIGVKERKRLILKNEFTKDEKKRVNTFKLVQLEDGNILIYVINGHSREKEIKFQGRFRLSLDHKNILKKWLTELD